MEPLPYGLVLKKKKKKKNDNSNNNNNISGVNEIKDNNDNKEINNTNEIILKSNSLQIKSEMDKNGFYPKTKYFINNDNNEDDKFPEKFNFEKIFPNLTSYFKNLDNNFSFDFENINNNNAHKNNEMSKMLRKYILDQSDKWNPELVKYIGYYWDTLDKKVKSHTLIFLSMVHIYIEKDKLTDYEKNILYWTILFHDVGKFHEMNTIYKEDYSYNKYIDKTHPFKSGIIFIATALKQDLIFFTDEKEKNEFKNIFEKIFIKALYESFEEEENNKYELFYNINFKHIDDIKKFLLKLKFHEENKWIYEILLLIIFHQSFPNNNPKKYGRHINKPLVDEKYIKELFDVRLVELMRIILIYDSSSHCLFSSFEWEQEIDKYFNLIIRNNYLEKEKNENSIVYLAELDGDVDDIIAIEYLYNNNLLKCIVCDPLPSTKIGKIREKNLIKLNIQIKSEIPEDTNIVFCGGALTLLSKYIINNKISTLVMNGGFVGNNIVPEKDILPKFKGIKTIRTFNFNSDVIAADKVLRSTSEQINKIILVGKNVCHSKNNTPCGIWNYEEFDYLFNKHRVKDDKCLHDLLMCHEGLCLLDLIDEEPYCEFEEVYPYNEGLNGEKTKWGSTKDNSNNCTPYRKVLSAIKYAF